VDGPDVGPGVRPERMVVTVIGAFLALLGVGLLAIGVALACVGSQRDSAGFLHTGTERVSAQGAAIVSRDLDLGVHGPWGADLGTFAHLRVRATAADPDEALFVGVARTADVDRYLAGVAHDVVDDFDVRPLRIDEHAVAGGPATVEPGAVDIWEASTSGTGRQTLEWAPADGHWTVVVMQADGGSSVDADVDLGVDVRHLSAVALGLAASGVLLVAGGIAVVVLDRRAHPRLRSAIAS
jgi:hypothetical protein